MPTRRGQQRENEDDAPRGGLSPRIERVFLYCLILHRTSPTYKNIYSRLKALLDHRAAPGEDPPRPSKVWIEAFLRRYDKLLREIDRAPRHETIENWFKLLNERETVRHGIKSRHRHCMDFVTLPLSRSSSARREFAVLFVTICSEGYCSMPPLVVFRNTNTPLDVKGWDNPLHANIAISKSGFPNKAMMLEWFKEFELRTRPSGDEEGEYRQLTIHNHIPLFSLELINHGIKHHADIITYALRTSHLIDPLDYRCIAQFRARYHKARDQNERQTGKRVDKAAFLRVIAEPYLETFTIPLIQSAFRKTGQWPISYDALKPRLPMASLDLPMVAEIPNFERYLSNFGLPKA